MCYFKSKDAGERVRSPDERRREGRREGKTTSMGKRRTIKRQDPFFPLSLPTLAVVSSEQEARSVPVGSHATVFTSSVWPCRREGGREGEREGGGEGGGRKFSETNLSRPRKRRREGGTKGRKEGRLTRNVCKGSGVGWLRSRSLIVLSALPVAKEVSFRQARSRMGASCRFFHFCCVWGWTGGWEGW